MKFKERDAVEENLVFHASSSAHACNEYRGVNCAYLYAKLSNSKDNLDDRTIRMLVEVLPYLSNDITVSRR